MRSARHIYIFGPLALIFALLPSASAHRLDECLQAARLDLTPDRFTLELDLTPGIQTADAFLSRIDLDRNGQVSGVEADAYGDLVRAAIQLRLDGRRLGLTVDDVTMPPPEEIRSGAGNVRIRLTTKVPALRAGPHRVAVRNRHQPVASVYLANALLPDTPQIEIIRQQRDRLQRNLEVQFLVRR